MGDKRRLTPQVEAAMTKRYMAGERAGALATAFGVDRGTVSDIVRRNGGTVRAQKEASGRPRFPQAEWIDRVTHLRDQDMSQQQISRTLGMSQAVVSRILLAAGRPTAIRRSGSAHGSWKGGIIRAAGGYLSELVPPDDPMASMRTRMGYVLQHRLVVARAIGRPLDPSETVHHINGVRDDNRLENLQLRQGRHGKGVRYVCADCGSHNVATATVGAED
jgi:predicted XRE-type DNA-binding protein